MNRKIVGGVAAVALVAVGAAGAVGVTNVSQAQAQGYGAYGCPGMGMMGPGMMGPGMMGPGMMGQSMMGQGMMNPGMMNPGMMGPGMMGMMGQQANLNLSANDVKAYLERWVAMTGNPRIKVGPVTERNDNTISADIVTSDRDALVQRFSVDRSTGIYRVVQ
jgi:hypothetical protein